MILGLAAVPVHYAESPPGGQCLPPTISRFSDVQRSCTIMCKTRKILCDGPGITFVAVIAAQRPAARYDRAACSGRFASGSKDYRGGGKAPHHARETGVGGQSVPAGPISGRNAIERSRRQFAQNGESHAGGRARVRYRHSPVGYHTREFSLRGRHPVPGRAHAVAAQIQPVIRERVALVPSNKSLRGSRGPKAGVRGRPSPFINLDERGRATPHPSLLPLLPRKDLFAGTR